MTSAPQEHTLVASCAMHVVALGERWQVEPERLLDGLGPELRWERLVDPAERVPLTAVADLIERARSLTGEPALGMFLGLGMQVSWHGQLGFAAMASPTLREAIELATRFTPTRTSALGLRLCVEGRWAALVLDERAPLGTARDVLVLSLLVGMTRLFSGFIGRDLRAEAHVGFAKPDYFARVSQLAPVPLHFSQPEHRLLFDAAALEMPLATADRAALRFAREQCERELEAVDQGGTLVARVRALVCPEQGGFQSIDDVARLVHVSTRTLKRRLSASGTSYSAILDQARLTRALVLLGQHEVSVDEIADRLGYSNAANFARAFRRLTGVSPSAFRDAAPGSRLAMAGAGAAVRSGQCGRQ